jgi:hypothetical protein
VTLITLYQRPVVDISFDPANPMPPAVPRAVRHLLDSPDAEVAIDGRYRRSPVDIVDWPADSYLDPGSDACEACLRAASSSSAQRKLDAR